MSDKLTTSAGMLKITDAEIQYLQGFIDRLDRGGYYMALYNMTGNVQALEQAQISTFSEGLGGTAFVANTLLQQFLPQGEYPGIYYMSQKVANESLLFIQDKLDAGGDLYAGYITRDEMLKSARSAWANGWKRDGGKDIEAYFPGNFLSSMLLLGTGMQQAGEVLEVIPSANLPPVGEVMSAVGDVLVWMFEEENVTAEEFMLRLNSEGMWAGFVGVFGAAFLGKRLSDYEEKPEEYLIYELPDAKYKVAVSIATNKIVGVFDNTLLPLNSTELLNDLSSIISALLAQVVGGSLLTAAEILDSFTGLLPELRRHLSESYTVGFNGDVAPLFDNTSAYPNANVAPQSPLSSAPTNQSETLWGVEYRGQVLHLTSKHLAF